MTITVNFDFLRDHQALIEKGSHAIGLKPPVTRAIIDKYTEDIAVDGSLIQKKLGFVPQYDFSFKNVRKILVFS